MNDQKTISIPAVDFRQGLKMAKHCAMKNNTRMNLQTFHIASKHGTGTIEATDGHRAGRYTFKTTGKYFDVMLSLDDFKAYMAQCPKDGEYEIIQPDPSRFSKFPNMDQIWPKSREFTFSLDHAQFKTAIKAAWDCRTPREKIFPLLFAFRAGMVRITSKPGEGVREFDYTMPVKRKPGDDFCIGLNARYIHEFLQAVPKGGEISIDCQSALNPSVFYSSEVKGYREILMPIRLKGVKNEKDWDPIWPEVVSHDPPENPKPEVEKRPDLIPEQETDTAARIKEAVKTNPVPVIFTPQAAAPKPVIKPGIKWGPVNPKSQDGKTASGPALILAVYSEKAFIITGNTKEHRARIMKAVPKASGIWHRKAEGWIFSRKHMAKFENKLKDLLAA